MNLYLGVGKKRAPLFQTPTVATRQILAHSRKVEILRAYFEWVEKNMNLKPGAVLDHKIEVLWFIIENPDAEFYEG